jgi:hypothetical protein
LGCTINFDAKFLSLLSALPTEIKSENGERETERGERERRERDRERQRETTGYECFDMHVAIH